MRSFIDDFEPDRQTRILDVGGTSTIWDLTDVSSSIVLFNLFVPDDAEYRENISWAQGDGCAMPYADGEFDVCFSNSTIEHLHTLDRQRRFAAEMRRVSRGIWLQTPARSFPFELHWLGFFIHWLPQRWQRRVARNFTLWGWVNRPTQEQVDELVDEYRLLSYREMRELFPDCEIRRERLLGLTKSYVAVRRLPL